MKIDEFIKRQTLPYQWESLDRPRIDNYLVSMGFAIVKPNIIGNGFVCRLGDYTIWETRSGWISAGIDQKNHYVNHKNHGEGLTGLETALNWVQKWK